MLIRFSSDIEDTPENREKYTSTYKDITITSCNIPECDILLVEHFPFYDIQVKCSETWIHCKEPPARIRYWEKESYKYFDRVLATWKDSTNFVPPCIPCHLGISPENIKSLSYPKKTKNLSWVTSNNKDLYGHRLRLQLVDFLKDRDLEYDLYGRGFKDIDIKFDAMKEHRYSLAIENFSANYYFTEKITDCFLSWTIPFYWGAPNIDRFFPKGSYIPIEPNDPESVLATITDYTNSNYYEENINLIKEARNIILEKYNYEYRLNELVKTIDHLGPRTERFIPKLEHPKVTGGIRKLKFKFNHFLSKHFNM